MKMGPKAWDDYRNAAISPLDEDRGWTRYIDPPINLYIVPGSEDPAILRSMHISIVRAMDYLDTPGDRFKIHDRVKDRADKKF